MAKTQAPDREAWAAIGHGHQPAISAGLTPNPFQGFAAFDRQAGVPIQIGAQGQVIKGGVVAAFWIVGEARHEGPDQGITIGG